MLHRGIKTTKELFDDGPLYTVKSILRVMPRKDHDNTTFTCQSQNAADRTPQNAKLRVEVSENATVNWAISPLEGGRGGRGIETRQNRVSVFKGSFRRFFEREGERRDEINVACFCVFFPPPLTMAAVAAFSFFATTRTTTVVRRRNGKTVLLFSVNDSR